MKLEEALLALAYGLLLLATLPSLAQFGTSSWAVVPVWLVLVGYAGSVLRYTAPSEQEAKRRARVVWLAWVFYYALAVVWPLPLHWYDVLVIASLIITPDTLKSSPPMALYYLLTAATYMQQQDALQVAGRLLLAGVTAANAAGAKA
jgi:hypothetical protein